MFPINHSASHFQTTWRCVDTKLKENLSEILVSLGIITSTFTFLRSLCRWNLFPRRPESMYIHGACFVHEHIGKTEIKEKKFTWLCIFGGRGADCQYLSLARAASETSPRILFGIAIGIQCLGNRCQRKYLFLYWRQRVKHRELQG